MQKPNGRIFVIVHFLSGSIAFDRYLYRLKRASYLLLKYVLLPRYLMYGVVPKL